MKFAALVGLVAGLWCYHPASGVTHTLQYFYTATSEISNFPEFVDVGMVDGVPISRYDSNTHRKVPLQEWMEKVYDQQYWDQKSEDLRGEEQTFIVNIQTAKKRFNQTGGVHTFQYMYGCQQDDKSGATDGFEQFGYDGEDFISLDLKNQRYIASKPQSLITKNKWDSDRAMLAADKNYFTQICIEWLGKYLQYGRSTLERKDRPEVSLLQKDSAVVCHATGFYPEDVMITWKRDGEEMQEDVDVGETLPNEDGTFQKRAVLTVSPEEWKNKQYTCVVTHQSEEILLDEADIKRSNPGSFPLVPIIAVVVVLIALSAIIAGVVVLRKKKKAGFTRASTDESSQSSSEKA